jgi:ribosomal protein S13
MLDSIGPFKLKSKNYWKWNFFQFFHKRFGIGQSFSFLLCKFSGIHPFLRLSFILDYNFDSFYENYYILKKIKFFFIENKYHLDSFLWKQKANAVKFLKSIGNLRGRNHNNALPVRGQRRRTNARTKKKIKF